MRIPTVSPHAASSGSTSILPFLLAKGDDGGDSGGQLREWSSIIGIVTAIIGNVLISFALNTQRYAHIRIEREFNDTRTPLKKGIKRRVTGGNKNGYGTMDQERVAEERLEANLAPENGKPHGKNTNGNQDGQTKTSPDAEETDPLSRSYESEDTSIASDKSFEDEQRKSYLKSPYWWAGIIMMTIGEGGNFIAYGFAPASIVSPLGVVALVVNCVIAPIMLKEKFRKRDFAGVAVAIAGAVVVVLSAKSSEDKMGPDDLWDAIKRWEFLTYLGITAALILVLMWASGKYGQRSILIDLGLVGLFGGYTALSTKGVASLLSDTLWRTLTFPITYVLVAVLVGSALLQIRYVNRALINFDSTQVIPIQFVLFTLSVIIGSAVLYRDFESATAQRVGRFVAGCLLTFLGVYLITSGRHGEDDETDDDIYDEDEGGIDLIDEEATEGQTDPSHLERVRAGSVTAEQKTKPSRVDGNAAHRPQSRDSFRLGTPSRRSSNFSASVPSVVATPGSRFDDIPPPFTNLDEYRQSPWDNETSQAPASQSVPRLQATQSSTQIETRPPTNPVTSAPTLLRLTSAPSDPVTPRPGTQGASPPKADIGSQSRINLAPPGTNTPQTPRSTRKSVSRLIPGPLISPLSSSLTAVVADSLRRGEGSLRRRRSILRRNRTSQRSQGHRQSAIEGEDDGLLGRSRTRDSTTNDNETPSRSSTSGIAYGTGTGTEDADVRDVLSREDLSESQKKSRLRSMSDTLGGMFTGGKKRRDGGDRGGDRV